MKMIGSSDFNIRYYEIDTMLNFRIKVFPFEIYYERNFNEYDTRIQFGISILGYRIGICLDHIGW